ncbi:MAG TPA: ATPase, T2SS/T4P/T4SS family [Rhodanobacteraceae bacterium]
MEAGSLCTQGRRRAGAPCGTQRWGYRLMDMPAPTRRRRPLLIEAERIIRSSFKPLQRYLDDPGTTEIMVNDPESVFVEDTHGMRKLEGVVLPENTMETVIRAILRMNDKELAPTMDARLDGFRIAAALPPVAVHGPLLVIRKHSRRVFTLDGYVRDGGFTPLPEGEGGFQGDDAATQRAAESGAAGGGEGVADFFRWAVRARKNILIVGATTSGKTSFASCLLREIPASDRIITCEDTHELRLEQPNVVQFEGLPDNDPAKAITIRSLIRLCLRCRPDHIVVGELRGPEAYDFLDALNTGHSGSICTLHANNALLGLRRLESLLRMSPNASTLPLRDMRTQIVSAVQYVVFQSRAGGIRGPEQILALDGINDATGDYRTRLIFTRVHPAQEATHHA